MEELATPREFTRTPQGFLVWQCCSSCAMCRLYNNATRLCVAHNTKVPATDLCQRWQMRTALVNIGDGELQEPKRPAYLQYVLERRIAEDQLIAQRLMKKEERASVFQLRQQWEHDNKQSIFMEL